MVLRRGRCHCEFVAVRHETATVQGDPLIGIRTREAGESSEFFATIVDGGVYGRGLVLDRQADVLVLRQRERLHWS